MLNARVCVIIAAAGMSRRMESITSSKQLIRINSTPVIEYSLRAFSNSYSVDSIIIVTKSEDIEETRRISENYPKVKCITLGGAERFDSVKIAFTWVPENADIVAIHDAARPLITTEYIDELIALTLEHGAVCPVGRVVDTVKRSLDGKLISDTLDRNELFAAQTPQMFKREIYKTALDFAKKEAFSFTDDASIVEHMGHPVYLSINPKPNVKITRPDDVEYARLYLKERASQMKIGHGYDVHKLVPDRALILGGVKLDYSMGLLGHSDADVLVHAIMDALIGALGLGDIGKHFPDTDERYKGISSILLLEQVKALIFENGYKVGNIDATVIAQKPKLLPHISQMRDNIAKALDCSVDLINVKATTEEGLGFTGTLEGISAHAVALIEKA